MFRILCFFLFAWAAVAQQQGPLTIRTSPEDHTPTLREDIHEVDITVTVTNLSNQLYTGLSRDNFELYEDGVRQQITHLSGEEVSISLGVIFDSSGSMKSKLDDSVSAVNQVFQAGMPGDEYSLLSFADSPEKPTNFTDNPEDIVRWTKGINAVGWTALYDAVYLGAQGMKHAKKNRRAILILSDGGDNNSRYTEDEVMSLVKEVDVPIFALGIGSHNSFLEKLTRITGGLYIKVGSAHPPEINEAVWKLNQAMRHQYVLAYNPPLRRDGKYHKVKVVLLPPPEAPPLRLWWRQGYYGPVE